MRDCLPARAATCVLELGIEAGEPAGNALEARVEPGERAGLGQALGDGVACTAPLPVQGRSDRGGASRNRLAVA